MSGLYLSRGLFPTDFLRPTVQFILDTQSDSGEIPWFEGYVVSGSCLYASCCTLYYG